MTLVTDLVFDVETTIHLKGHPFSNKNKLCYIGLYDGITKKILSYHNNFDGFNLPLTGHRIIGFNIKFDLHWLRKIGNTNDLPIKNCIIWDCQLAEFLLSGQTHTMPSLENTLKKYNLPPKSKYIEEKYWNKFIDTLDIPQEEMKEYLSTDLETTYALFKHQQKQFIEQPQLYKLFLQQCKDLVILEEIEWNGLLFNTKLAEEESIILTKELKEVEEKILTKWCKDIPFNLSSTDHKSVLLYGGTITDIETIPIGVYKTGQRIGQTRYKHIERQYKFPGYFTPFKDTELLKEGYYSSAEPILQGLKAKKKYIELLDLLLRRAEISKLLRTYYEGTLSLIKERDWEDNILHGSFNQCVARTGRLSSSKPNQQNWDAIIKNCIMTQYAS